MTQLRNRAAGVAPEAIPLLGRLPIGNQIWHLALQFGSRVTFMARRTALTRHEEQSSHVYGEYREGMTVEI